MKGFLLALSKLVHRQSLLLLKPTQTLVMNETWNTLENYKIYNLQTRKKVTFPFICNQLRWTAKTLPSKHNPKRRFLCAKNPTGGGRWPRAQKATCWDLVIIISCTSSIANKAWCCFTGQRNQQASQGSQASSMGAGVDSLNVKSGHVTGVVPSSKSPSRRPPWRLHSQRQTRVTANAWIEDVAWLYVSGIFNYTYHTSLIQKKERIIIRENNKNHLHPVTQ